MSKVVLCEFSGYRCTQAAAVVWNAHDYFTEALDRGNDNLMRSVRRYPYGRRMLTTCDAVLERGEEDEHGGKLLVKTKGHLQEFDLSDTHRLVAIVTFEEANGIQTAMWRAMVKIVEALGSVLIRLRGCRARRWRLVHTACSGRPPC